MPKIKEILKTTYLEQGMEIEVIFIDVENFFKKKM